MPPKKNLKPIIPSKKKVKTAIEHRPNDTYEEAMDGELSLPDRS